MDKVDVIAGLVEAKQQWDCPVAVDWAIEKIEALDSENAALRMEQNGLIKLLEKERAELAARGPVLSEEGIAHLYLAEMACAVVANSAQPETINQTAFVAAGQFVRNLLERAKR